MPQSPRPQWKKAVLQTVAHAERVLRGKTSSISADPNNLRQIRNFLVLQFESPLGSVMHATPFYEALKTAMPDAHVTVAASPTAASVLRHNPFIDRCVVTPNPCGNFRQVVHVVRELFREMPSCTRCIVTTIGNRRPRLAILATLAGKAVRLGHTAAPELYDVPLIFVPERGQIEGNLDILRALGHEVAFCEPRIFFTLKDADSATCLLEYASESVDQPRIVFVTQTSGGQLNQWSEERFQQVIVRLTHTSGAIPIFVGTAEDVSAIDSLRQNLPQPGVSLAGKTSIAQLSAVLAQADLIVSLDTGTFHVARAVGLPGVVIAPAWQDPREWLPVEDPRYRVLRGPAISAPPAGYRMEEVHSEQVVAAALELLKEFPPSIKARATRLDRALVDKTIH